MKTWQAEDSVIIRAKVEKIFSTLLDYNNFGRNFGLGFLKYGYWTRILGDEQVAKEGSIISHRILTVHFRRRVEKIESNNRIVERYIGPNYEGSCIWELQELSDGVELKFVYDAADTGWQSKMIFLITGTGTHHFFYSSGLNRLKRKLERDID